MKFVAHLRRWLGWGTLSRKPRRTSPRKPRCPLSVEALEVRMVPSATRGAIAAGLTHSAENYQGFLAQAYQSYLGRAPDASGEQYWVNRMSQGTTDEQVEAG